MKLKGDNGYIDYHKSKYLKIAITLLIVVLVIYVLGQTLVPEFLVYYFQVGAALMILPTAQYFTKFLLFNRFKSGSEVIYKTIKEISEKLLVLSDLIIVRGKKTIYCDFVVVTDKHLVFYSSQNKRIKESKKNEIKEIIKNIFESKGYVISIEVIDNEDEYINHIKHLQEERINQELQKQFGEIILQNSI